MAYTRETKETRALLKSVLEILHYDQFNWQICGDFKIIGILMGLQSGFVKHGCFICEWDSRDKEQYTKVNWPIGAEYSPGVKNIKYEPLVPNTSILIPPLHIKVGLYKKFLKALDKESSAIDHLHNIFPKLSDAKIYAGILNGPDINKLRADSVFFQLLSSTEQIAWQSLNTVVDDFLC